MYEVIKPMPNRRPHDFIAVLEKAGISEKEVKIIVANLEKLVQAKPSVDLEGIVKKIISDSKAKDTFLRNPWGLGD